MQDNKNQNSTCFYDSYIEQLSHITTMKEKLLNFFYNDNEYHQLVKWLKNQKILKSIESKLPNSTSSDSPLTIIEKHCSSAAEDLAQSSVILCVYGNINVGKSTFCNLLLGKNLLYVTNVQCTAVTTTVASAPESSTSGRVLIDEQIDIINLLDNIEEKQPKIKEINSWVKCANVLRSLDKKRKELSTNLVSLDNFHHDLPIVSSLYPELRQERIFSHIEISSPILGYKGHGLSLMDCPGILENELLTHIAKSGVQLSSIIFFIMNSIYDLTDSDLRFLSCQVRNGSAIFFIFNRRDEDSEDVLQQRLLKIRTKLNEIEEFKDAYIYLLNLYHCVNYVTNTDNKKDNILIDTEQKLLDKLLKDIVCVIEDKMKNMVFQFARSFFNLLHTNFLLLSKIISHKMKLKITSNISKNNNIFSSSVGLISRIKGQDPISILSLRIKNLIKLADKLINEYKDDLKHLYSKVVKDIEPKLLILARNHKTKLPYEKNDKSWVRTLFRKRKNSPFEEELFTVLITLFANEFSREFADWITSTRIKFSKIILEEASGIQESVNTLRDDLTKSEISLEMHTLITQTEKHIGNIIAHRLSIAGPVVGLLATSVGVGVGTPLLLVGVVSGAIITGGMMLLAGVAAAGIIGGILSVGYINKINNQTEEEARELIFSNCVSKLYDWPNASDFNSFTTKSVSSLIEVRDLVQSTLSLSIIQVETLLKPFDVENISYEDLCNYLYMRENTEIKIKGLCELVKEFDKTQELTLPSLFSQVQKIVTQKYIQQQGTLTSATDELIGCHYPECLVCKKEFIHCTHICASCRVTFDKMGNCPCPSCNKGTHILVQSSPHYKTMEEMFHNNDSIAFEAEPNANDWLPFYSNEKARLKDKILSSKSDLVHYFVTWFNKTFQNSHSSELITVRNIINHFISSFIQKLSPKKVPDLYRRILTEALQEIIFPQIYDNLFLIYKQHFKSKDDLILRVMNDLKDESPSFYQDEIEWEQESIEQFPKAIEKLHDFDKAKIPLEKLRCLVSCYEEFSKIIPKDFAVGADLLVPTLVYFIIQSRIQHLTALFALVFDALDHTELIQPDEEYLFVTIQSLVLEFPKICGKYTESNIDTPLRI